MVTLLYWLKQIAGRLQNTPMSLQGTYLIHFKQKLSLHRSVVKYLWPSWCYYDLLSIEIVKGYFNKIIVQY